MEFCRGGSGFEFEFFLGIERVTLVSLTVIFLFSISVSMWVIISSESLPAACNRFWSIPQEERSANGLVVSSVSS